MQAYVSSWIYRAKFEAPEYTLFRFLDDIKAIGGAGIEIYPKHMKGADPEAELVEVKKLADAKGLGISALILANDFARPTAIERAEQVERAKRFIGWTAAAGIANLNVFTGYHQAGEDPFMEAMRVIDAFREVAPVAREKGVTLCLENHSSVVNDIDGLMKLIAEIGDPALKSNPDPSNFVPEAHVRGEKSLEAMYPATERYATVMANAHLKIGDFKPDGEHSFIDVARIIGIFRKAGYDGPVVLETYGTPDQYPAEETCRQGLDLLRRHFAAESAI